MLSPECALVRAELWEYAPVCVLFHIVPKECISGNLPFDGQAALACDSFRRMTSRLASFAASARQFAGANRRFEALLPHMVARSRRAGFEGEDSSQ